MRSGTSIPVVSAGAAVCLIALLMAGSSAPATAETKPAIAVTPVFYGDKRVPVSWTCGRDFTADARRLCVPATREPGSWSVAGRVMDQDTLEPIADAKVRLFGRVVDPRRGRLRLKMVARTNHRGDYAFAAIPRLLPGTTVTEVTTARGYGRYRNSSHKFRVTGDEGRGDGYGGNTLMSEDAVTFDDTTTCPCGTGLGGLADTGAASVPTALLAAASLAIGALLRGHTLPMRHRHASRKQRPI